MANTTLQLGFFEKTTKIDAGRRQQVRSEITNRMYLLQDKNLYVLESSQNGDGNVRLYSNKVYSQYKLRHTFNVDIGTDLLMATTEGELSIYKCDKQNLSFQYKYKLNNGNSETDISFGRFYPDTSKMGMIIRTKNTIMSYEISNDFSIKKKPNSNSEILSSHCDFKEKLLIVNLEKSAKQMIICKVGRELKVFDFNTDDRMKLMMIIRFGKNEEATSKEDTRFFFANISGHPDWMDIVLFNSKGMFVFRFEENYKDFYKLINQNAMFSAARGWTGRHMESVKFEDTNGDGIDDLIFTGPAGIEILSYDYYANRWRSLMTVERLAPEERHTMVLHVMPRIENENRASIIFSLHSNAIHIAKVIETPAELLEIPSINEHFPVSTSKCRRETSNRKIIERPRSTLYLKDRNIWFDQRETVNPRTGKPFFTLPLVGASHEMVKFHLTYDASNNANSPIGIGWSMLQNCITLSYQDSNFEEDESYVWILDNMPQKLKPLYGKSPSGKLSFQLENVGKEISTEEKKIRVSHIVSNSTWEIDYGNSYKLFYGKHEAGRYGAIATDLGWENWRGRGFDTANVLERAHVWYLAAAEFKGIRSYFEYEEKRKTSDLGSYNAEALLTKIRDGFNEISFFYESHPGSKSENEHFYLANYTYRTTTSEQTVVFKRSSRGTSFLLTGIEQFAQPVVRYEYNEIAKGKFVLTKSILPTGVEVAYNYKLLASPAPITEFSARRIPVSDDYNVSYGPGFTLVSYLDKNAKKVILRMFNNELTKEILPSTKSTNPWPPLHYSNAEAHEILIGDGFIAVIVYSNHQKLTCLIGRQSDGNWKVPPQCYVHSEESTILNDNNYILVSDPMSSVFLIEWLRDQNKWQTQLTMDSFKSLRSISANGNKFIIYDDQSLALGYKSKTNPQLWNLKKLMVFHGYLSETRNILLKFNLKTDFFKALWIFFRNNALQLRHNLIVLSALGVHENEALVTKIKTFVIGRDYNIVTQNATIVLQDNLPELFSAEEFNAHGDKFSLKYVYRDDKFRIDLATFKSPKGRLAKDIYEEMNFPNAQRFLLDLKNYYVSLRGQAVECRNVKYVFNGNNWIRSSIDRNEHFEDSTSVLLGDRFVVNKTDQYATIKLYDATNEVMLFDFGAKNIKDVRVNYPVYIASHDGESLKVIEFVESDETAFTSTTLPKSIQLSPFGNAMSLVTSKSEANGGKHLLIWPMYVRQFLPTFAVTSVRVALIGPTSGGSNQRLTGYVYNENSSQMSSNGIHFGQVTVLPGNSRNKFGFLTIGENSIEYFNDKRNLVKRVELSSNSGEEQSEAHVDDVQDKSKETTLYDKSGMMEIARFPQILLAYQMASYTGFESYETMAEHWIYDRANIVRGQFALTGQSYLHLNAKPMKGMFRPKFQDRPFLVSCWIRLPCEKHANIEDIVPHLTIVVRTANGNDLMNLLAEVKLQIDNWSYLEVGVDMELMHLISDNSNNEDLDLEIRVSPSANLPIDLDNIRFSSLRNIFDVNVYDRELAKCVAIIKSSGAIVRFIYDKYQKKIADINESNQIETFVTYTKASHQSNRFANPSSVVEVIPKRGYFQSLPMLLTKHFYIDTRDIEGDSYGFRCLYSLPVRSEFSISDLVKLQRSRTQATIALRDEVIKGQQIPAQGEVLLLKQQSRVIVWIDGSLYYDQHSRYGQTLKLIVAAGEVQIWDMMVFSRLQVRVAYKNALNEEIQEITLSSADRAIVREQLHDELGRQRITIQPAEIVCGPKQSVLAYVADFVTNDDPSRADSVWKTGRLKGAISDLVRHEFGYSETVYDNNPLNTVIRIGLAGEKFSASGEFARYLNSTTSNTFLTGQYPPGQFTYQILSTPSGGEKISIFNERNFPVAIYIHVEKGRDRFSTFEYNDMGLMTKCWPSLYFEKTGTFDASSLDLIAISRANRGSEQKLATSIDYDGKGNPTRKATPDAGPVENVYDNDDRLRFIVQYLQDEPHKIQCIVYFEYDALGRLTSTGTMKSPLRSSELLQINISEDNASEYQRFYYSDAEEDPMFRHNLLRTITTHYGEPLHEESIFDSNGNVLSKRVLIPNGSDRPEIVAINKRFEGDLLQEVIYPASMFGEPFRVAYEYDMLGRMVSVGVPGQANRFLSATYNADDQVASETFTPLRGNRFTRRYRYNEPGYPIEIDDPFLREEISYTEAGYGSGRGYGDGTITRVKFTAKWHRSANGEGIGVQENHLDSQKCLQELKREGYLDSNNQQTRVLYPELDVMLSLACTNGTMEQRVKEVLGKYGFPKEYGYRFDYTDHMEMRKAKYFVGTEEPTCLRSSTFHREIPGIDMAKSRLIWELLKLRGYIVENEKDQAIQGRTFLRSTLLRDLKSVNPEFAKYEPWLRKFLVMQYAKKQLPSNAFSNFFAHASADDASINQLLSRGNYFQNPLQPDFVDSLQEFTNFLPNIVAVLHRYFGANRAEFDMDSPAIDSNGNIRQISTGYKHFRLRYKENSNQISEIIASNGGERNSENYFTINHDIRGNVNQALHKGVWIMEHHPVSNRLEKALLANGEKIVTYSYDSKGERATKRVKRVDGQMLSETRYFRDELGRSLVERRSTFGGADQAVPDVLVTMYIYGPKSLVGFVRRDQFYSVITDHEGSVRLIVRDGEVVAAYDYTPYGDLMRSYGNNPDAHILYRFIGQEWDPDLKLYNYHGRIYDPVIGRFYQTDPAAQYFSPYKYAGNSPVSMVDSNGEIAIMLVCAIIAFAMLGAYLSGAAVNGNLNPLCWDWYSRDTQLAIFTGAVTGALLPIGFSASIVALGGFSIASATLVTSVGLAASYLSVAASNEEWNPGNWDYVSIKTWSAAFEGFSMGVGIIGGWQLAGQKFLALGSKGKLAFGAVSAFYGGEVFVTGAANANWDLDSPEFWLNTANSVASVFDLSMLGRSIIKFIGRKGGKLLKSSRKMNAGARKNFKFPRMTENGRKNALTVGGFAMFTATAAYLMNGDFAQWDQMHLQTYHNILAAHVMSGQYLEAIAKIKEAEKHQMPTKQLSSTVAKHLRNAANQIMIVKRLGRFIRSLSESSENTNFILSLHFTDSLLTFTRNRFTNPFIIFKNSIATDNPTLVANAIGSVRRLLQKMIYDNFHQWNIAIEIATGFDRNIIEQCKREVEKLLNSKNGSIIDRDSIDRILRNFALRNDKSRWLQQQYLSKERELTYLKSEIYLTSIRSSLKVKLLIEAKYLKMQIADLKRQERELIDKSRSALEYAIWNKLKTFHQDSIENFEIENFVGQPKIELEKSIYLPNPNTLDSAQDITFISSFKPNDVPVLTAFQKCYNCIKTASKARIHVKDIRWLAFLNENYNTQSLLLPRKLHRKRRFVDAEIHENNSINQSRPRSTALNSKSDENEKEKLFPNIDPAPWSLMNFGDKLVAQLTNNGTLLLAEVLLARYKKCKLFRVSQDNFNSVYTLELALACEVISLSEKTIEAAANASDIPMNFLDMSGEFQLQKEILKMLKQRKYEKIPDLIISFALNALPEANNPKFGKLSRRKIDRYQAFLRSFNLNSQIDEIFRKSKIFSSA